MGLKAALIVVTAGVGAYYAYTMMTSSETGEDGEVTRAHAVPKSGTMHVPRLNASASAAQPEAVGTEDAPPAPEPQPVRTDKLITSAVKPGSAMKSYYKPVRTDKLMQMAKALKRAPAPRPPMQHWLEAHQLA